MAASIEFNETQIKALNRALIFLLNVLVAKNVLTVSEKSWMNFVKQNGKLALYVDKEDLFDNLIDLCGEVACPNTIDGCVALLRNHIIKPKKVRRPVAP